MISQVAINSALFIHLFLALARDGDFLFQSTMQAFISSPLRGWKMEM